MNYMAIVDVREYGQRPWRYRMIDRDSITFMARPGTDRPPRPVATFTILEIFAQYITAEITIKNVANPRTLREIVWIGQSVLITNGEYTAGEPYGQIGTVTLAAIERLQPEPAD